MTHRITDVKTLDDFVVFAVFQDGTEKEYDIRNMYEKFPQFQQLEKDVELFQKMQVDVGGYGISWNDELDLSADEIWDHGTSTGRQQDVDIKLMVGYKLTEARCAQGMTQKELAEKTGIYQADISNIERGRANPSVQTLQRLAEGMGMKVEVEFVD